MTLFKFAGWALILVGLAGCAGRAPLPGPFAGDMPDLFQCPQSALGEAYLQGELRQTDYAASADLCRQDCDDGDITSCKIVAWAYWTGRGVAKDEALGAKAYIKACNGRDGDSCRLAARAYASGIGVGEDPAKAASFNKQAAYYYKEACSAGDGRSCFLLGKQYAGGTGVEKDAGVAEHYFVRAAEINGRQCTGGDAAACRALGFAYADGEGLDQNQKKADTAHRRACRLGDKITCNDLAWAMATSSDPRRHDGKAAVKLALRANALSQGNAIFYDTLAAAYARDGQFARAVEHAKKAIAAATDRQQKSAYAERLNLYDERRPYQRTDK